MAKAEDKSRLLAHWRKLRAAPVAAAMALGQLSGGSQSQAEEVRVVLSSPTAQTPGAVSTLESVLVYQEPTSTTPVPPTKTVRPSPVAELTVTPTPEKASDPLFTILMKPFLEEAEKRRAERAIGDPEYTKRIDEELNVGRINFLLFGFGETHEPPLTERAIIGSYTIVSLNLETGMIDIVSLTHDIRAPEIERAMGISGQKGSAKRIDAAFDAGRKRAGDQGGFDLMRLTLEDATGLSMDFQTAFEDSMIVGLIDDVFQGIDVEVPEDFAVNGFYLDGKKYDGGHFAAGKQRLNGKQVIQFIKTVAIEVNGPPKKTLEHNARKHLVLQSLTESFQDRVNDLDFWVRSSKFVGEELIRGKIKYDFDIRSLVLRNIGNISANFSKFAAQKNPSELGLPHIGQTEYIVDFAHGGKPGAVQWVKANAVPGSITERDVRAGIYPMRGKEIDMEVPFHANPYGDLATEYWPSVRTLIKEAFAGR